MKFVIIICALIVAAASLTMPAELGEKLFKVHKGCKAQSEVDDEMVIKAVGGNLADDPKLKDHIFCVSQKMGFQNDAGELQLDRIKENLHIVLPDQVKAAAFISKCTVQKETPTQTAFEIVQCFQEVHKS